jgi:hypothetical protein
MRALRSTLTRLPAASVPSVVRARVSAMASKRTRPPATDTTV